MSSRCDQIADVRSRRERRRAATPTGDEPTRDRGKCFVFGVTSSAGAVMALRVFATAASVAELVDRDPYWWCSGLR